MIEISAIEALRRAEDPALLREIAAGHLRTEQEEGGTRTLAFRIGYQILMGLLPDTGLKAATEHIYDRPN